jgi:hypothetical protein
MKFYVQFKLPRPIPDDIHRKWEECVSKNCKNDDLSFYLSKALKLPEEKDPEGATFKLEKIVRCVESPISFSNHKRKLKNNPLTFYFEDGPIEIWEDSLVDAAIDAMIPAIERWLGHSIMTKKLMYHW